MVLSWHRDLLSAEDCMRAIITYPDRGTAYAAYKIVIPFIKFKSVDITHFSIKEAEFVCPSEADLSTNVLVFVTLLLKTYAIANFTKSVILSQYFVFVLFKIGLCSV